MSGFGTTYSEKITSFLNQHQEFQNTMSELLGTYTTCQARELKGSAVDPQEAYRHIFTDGCDWCKENYEFSRKLVAKYIW